MRRAEADPSAMDLDGNFSERTRQPFGLAWPSVAPALHRTSVNPPSDGLGGKIWGTGRGCLSRLVTQSKSARLP